MIRKKDRTSVDPSLSGIWALGISAALQYFIYKGVIHLHLNILPLSNNCRCYDLDIALGHIAISIIFRLIVQT